MSLTTWVISHISLVNQSQNLYSHFQKRNKFWSENTFIKLTKLKVRNYLEEKISEIIITHTVKITVTVK